jgi:hypothetical protein
MTRDAKGRFSVIHHQDVPALYTGSVFTIVLRSIELQRLEMTLVDSFHLRNLPNVLFGMRTLRPRRTTWMEPAAIQRRTLRSLT